MWTSGALAGNRTIVALADNTVAAAISYSEPHTRDAIDVKLAPLLRAFGLWKGTLAYWVMRYEFAGRLPVNLGRSPYIELLAVHPAYRRQGLARGAIRELVDRLERSGYSIQVDSSNQDALSLYVGMGFREVVRTKEPWSAAREAGNMERVFMQLTVSDMPDGGSPNVQARTGTN